MSLGQIVALWW